jgi:hypothetical protein
MVFFRYIVLNTLHKSDKDSKNNYNNNNKFQNYSRQYLSIIPGEHEIKGLQKTAILGTAHTHTHTHTAEIGDVKVPNIFHGRNNITCSTDCKYRAAATLYALETCLISGVYL